MSLECSFSVDYLEFDLVYFMAGSILILWVDAIFDGLDLVDIDLEIKFVSENWADIQSRWSFFCGNLLLK